MIIVTHYISQSSTVAHSPTTISSSITVVLFLCVCVYYRACRADEYLPGHLLAEGHTGVTDLHQPPGWQEDHLHGVLLSVRRGLGNGLCSLSYERLRYFRTPGCVSLGFIPRCGSLRDVCVFVLRERRLCVKQLISYLCSCLQPVSLRAAGSAGFCLNSLHVQTPVPKRFG